MYQIKLAITTVSAKYIHTEKIENIQNASSKYVLPNATFSLLWPRYIFCPCNIFIFSSVNQFCNSNKIIEAILDLVTTGGIFMLPLLCSRPCGSC